MSKSYEQTASGNIINSILNYQLKRFVSSLRLPKEQKQAKTAISRKKLSEKSVEGIKMNISLKTFLCSKIY